MKKFLKRYSRYLIAFEVASRLIPGFSYQNRLENLLLAVLVFTLLNRFLKPIFKLLLLPINLLTFGLFRWISHALTFFILTLVLKDVVVRGFTFTGFEFQGFIIPQLYVSPFLVYILVAFLISLIYNYFLWLNR